MITKNIKHYIAAGVLCCGTAVALTACSDWSDHFEDPVSDAGNATLWQTMKQRPELSDFCEVLQQTKVVKNHRTTAVSYAELLDGTQTFTVFAPVNGTFNKDSLLSLVTTARGDSMVERSFIGNHLSYNIGSSVDTPTELFLLNAKRLVIEDNKVLNVPITEANVKAKGGVLHVMQNRLPYRYNLYEVMLNNPAYSAIGEQLASYQHDEFMPAQSVEGDMVDGEQVYVDSVFYERNLLMERIGALSAEDSSYTFIVPEAQEWERVWQEAMDYFRYDSSVADGDSLQRYWANAALLGDAVFSRTIQTSPTDSLKTYAYDRHYPKYHVFHRPFEPGGILYGASATEYSNGTLYTTQQWPFTPQMTYHREIKAEGERLGLVVNDSLCNYVTRVLAADSVSENAYLDIIATSSSRNWTMTFKLENTLAGAYDICAVILPLSVYDPNATLRPNRFQVDLNYVDANGKAVLEDFGQKKFSNDPTRVDTVVIAENFVFPVCNYDQTNLKFTLKLKCSILPRENTTYSREMYLDCIFLRPRNSKPE